MARSRRKTPMIGVTTCESEKQDKRIANRALRHAATVAVSTGNEVLPTIDAVSSVWGMGKDGKRLFDPAKQPELMRK